MMNFNTLKNWFYHSETILWARLQMLFGITWAVLSVTDLAPVLNPKYLTYWAIINGVVTEYLRRRGTESIVVTVPAQSSAVDQTPTVMTVLSDTPSPGS